jgi:hypothetical protein
MIKEIILTENYLLILSDDLSIKRGWFYCVRTKNIFHDEGEDINCCMGDRSITHHLPLNDAKPLNGVMLLPELEGEVQELAYDFSWNHQSDPNHGDTINIFKAGYNKAREKYRFTEDAMIEFGRWIISNPSFANTSSWSKDTAQYYLNNWQSLQQPQQPKYFEFHTQRVADKTNIHRQWNEPRTATNSLGQLVAVGVYKFELKIHL